MDMNDLYVGELQGFRRITEDFACGSCEEAIQCFVFPSWFPQALARQVCSKAPFLLLSPSLSREEEPLQL